MAIQMNHSILRCYILRIKRSFNEKDEVIFFSFKIKQTNFQAMLKNYLDPLNFFHVFVFCADETLSKIVR